MRQSILIRVTYEDDDDEICDPEIVLADFLDAPDAFFVELIDDAEREAGR